LLHLLVLTAMVLGLRVIQPPPEDQAVQIELIPPAIPRPPPLRRPAPSAPAPRPAAPIVARPRPPTQAAPAPAAPLPLAPAPARPAPAPQPPPGYDDRDDRFRSGLRVHLGCADPDPFHLTPQEREVCGQKLAEAAKTAKPLVLEPPEAKDADYQRKQRCREVYKRQSIPSSASHDDSTGAQIGGLGYNPSLQACGPGDR
jgi:hypothetical protein